MALVPRRLPLLSGILAALLAVRGFAAELPVIRLDTVFPPGGQIGAEVEVAITGEDLDEANALHFSHPGITAEAKEKGFVVKIAPDVPPGIYDVRVSGLLGISNPRAFVVSDLPQKANPGGNQTPEGAIELPADSVIAGAAGEAAADWFKFTARQGQRLLIVCEAPEIDSRLRPVLAVLDAAGDELEISRRGGLLDFTAPADGGYLLKLHDLSFAGGANHFYRLALTTGPHIDCIFPPCGAPGTKGAFTIYGRNLPGSAPAGIAGHDGRPLEKLDVEIDIPATGDPRADGLSSPAAAALDGFSFRLKSPRVSNPIFIGFAGGPVVAEQEPNNVPGEVQTIAPPCEVAGRFFPGGDADTFGFDAKKGEVWWIEVVSERLDLPVNPFLLIQRESADVQECYGADADIGGLRFRTASNDPALRFEVKEDGAYRLTLRDLFTNSSADPRNVYRLAIRRESPGFHLAALAEPPPENNDDRSATPRAVFLRGDDTTAIKVLAFRRDGFAGDIELHAEGLPEGVSCAPGRILAGKNEGVLLLTSRENPERWAGAIRITGTAKIGDAETVREARGGAVCWKVGDGGNEAVPSRLTRDIALAVSGAEPAPVSFHAAGEDKVWEIAAGAKAEIPIEIVRRGEFKQGLKLKTAGAPGAEAIKEIDVAADAATATVTIDPAAAKIPAGGHTIHFTAQTKGKFRGKDVVTTIYSEPIRITVQPPQPE